MNQQVLIILLTVATLAQTGHALTKKEHKMNEWRKLTPKEEQVIVQKGTEAPFSGRFDTSHAEGIYTCRRCGAALYRSDDKFDSGCGWPSFDAEIPGAVKRLPDPDGRRVEIECAHCGGHLGHVFTGERLTARNTRHCVNSISMDFIPAADTAKHFEKAIFAGGCFWGVEYYLQKAPGVIRTRVGYTGGHKERPTYEDVCSRTTGHAEAVEVVYDPLQTSFGKLARLFFEVHDPTQLNRQGPDRGDEYRSEIFYTDESQKKTAEQLITELKNKGWKVVTQLEPATTFWQAETYHEDYYQRNGQQPYCHHPVPRFDRKP